VDEALWITQLLQILRRLDLAALIVAYTACNCNVDLCYALKEDDAVLRYRVDASRSIEYDPVASIFHLARPAPASLWESGLVPAPLGP
jgi:hypothetical protein